MDLLDGLALARDLWPRFVAVLIFGALVFFPKPTYGLIKAEAEHRAQEYTALVMETLVPDAKPQGDKRVAGHRHSPTGAPTGARLLHRNKPARP